MNMRWWAEYYGNKSGQILGTNIEDKYQGQILQTDITDKYQEEG